MTEQPWLFELCEARGICRCPGPVLEGVVCKCSKADGHQGTHVCEVCHSSFHAIPSGPRSDVPDADAGSHEAYVAWRQTVKGHEVFEAAERAALEVLRQAEAAEQVALGFTVRFSPRTFIALYRQDFGVRINNNFSPWLGDELIQKDPQLERVIERRARKKAAA